MHSHCFAIKPLSISWIFSPAAFLTDGYLVFHLSPPTGMEKVGVSSLLFGNIALHLLLIGQPQFTETHGMRLNISLNLSELHHPQAPSYNEQILALWLLIIELNSNLNRKSIFFFFLWLKSVRNISAMREVRCVWLLICCFSPKY